MTGSSSTMTITFKLTEQFMTRTFKLSFNGSPLSSARVPFFCTRPFASVPFFCKRPFLCRGICNLNLNVATTGSLQSQVTSILNSIGPKSYTIQLWVVIMHRCSANLKISVVILQLSRDGHVIPAFPSPEPSSKPSSPSIELARSSW
jgi:hypothetical protein